VETKPDPALTVTGETISASCKLCSLGTYSNTTGVHCAIELDQDY